MAKGKTDKKAGVKNNAGSAKLGMRGRLILAGGTVAGVIFLPTSMILLVGMLPTIVMFFTGGRRGRTKISTIAALNMVGCLPFVMKLWAGENNFDYSIMILSSPMTIVIIYGAALVGYLLDWVVTGAVSAFMYQKAERRLVAIQERQDKLIEEWGQEVVGKNVDPV